MKQQEIIARALQLKAAERFEAEEAVHRLRACDEGRMKTMLFEEIFGKRCGERASKCVC